MTANEPPTGPAGGTRRAGSWPGEIVGHRGAAGLAPENTLASFEAAIAAGADRVEFDVRLTSDRVAVIFHDAALDRFVPDAHVRGPRLLLELESAVVLDVDVGARFGRPGTLVPTLAQVLDALRGRIRLNVEVKGEGPERLVTLAACIAAVRERGLAADTVISSFHEDVVRRAADEAPEIERALIVGDRASSSGRARAAFADRAADAGCGALHPRHVLVDALLRDRCRERGLKLRPWTVNGRREMERLIALDVDGIVTDRPDRLREAAGR